MSSPTPPFIPIPNSPLNEDHLAQINRALQALDAAELQVDMAQRAGIDMSQRKTDIQNLRKQYLQVKQVYFPGR